MPRFADTQPVSPHSNPMALGNSRRDAVFFVVTLLYIWISVAPFENLAAPPVPHAAANQLTGLVIAMLLGAFALRHRLTGLLLRPRLPILLLFSWLAICSVVGAQPGTSLQRLVFTGLLCFITSVLVVMPHDRRQFDRMMAIFAIILLALCYLGVIFLSSRSIHQPFDLDEKALAGDWRGIFNHKNAAAPAMIILFLIGLYLRNAWSTVGGIAIAVLAGFFLWKTNGKTAAMLLPVSIVLVWFMERHASRTLLMISGLLGFLNLLAVGSTYFPSIQSLVESLGIDSTFTGRTDIWRLSFDTFAQSPIFGQGFQAFWASERLLSQADIAGTWAVAAYHAHNGYIESLLNGGLPAFVLTIVWLVIIPANDFRKAVDRGTYPALTTLFARIWVYALLSSCLESNFFTGTGPIWSSLLIAVYCLKHQAHNVLEEGP
ncbi:Wzy-type polysaccharide biosynthesis protein UppY [Agrobacterium tumefaciens]|uniref:Wzy-type polysaccharide biosynthesis protein UppY n=1 Tax=Agrobacterium tumefaciens TaxID=358 RepID=UPI00287D72E5|nr:Wzy-type polysaccharide biosynthesis protein UppY [Agrobacterium tumefaciens]MDS7597788.1 O-antigen ligase family protein [Agrobacterium tumefaciens]